jgi:transcriptional regulator of acetoin/glycerol metabolism
MADLTLLKDAITSLVLDHLIEAGWNQREASKTLGISRWALSRLIKKHGIELPVARIVAGLRG